MKKSRNEIYDLLGLQPEIIKKLEVIDGQIDLEEIDIYLKQMMNMETAEQAYRQLKDLLQNDEDHLKMLYCQLECARRIYDKYQEKRIAETVYADTMRCFARFIDECEKKNGRMFFDRGWWTYRQLSMNIFRIGALEYQFKAYDGEDVIGLHIPSDSDLLEESVNASLAQAEIFFRTYYSDYRYDKYTCNSWLMSPALKPLLSQESNILSFQNRFDIIEENPEDKEYIEWLFQVPIDTDYEKLPTETGLQKKVKELLLNGGTVGSAFGIMPV